MFLFFIRVVTSEILPSRKASVSEASYRLQNDMGQLWRFQNLGTGYELVNCRRSTVVQF